MLQKAAEIYNGLIGGGIMSLVIASVCALIAIFSVINVGKQAKNGGNALEELKKAAINATCVCFIPIVVSGCMLLAGSAEQPTKSIFNNIGKEVQNVKLDAQAGKKADHE